MHSNPGESSGTRQEIRASIVALCEQFGDGYWREHDRAASFPEAFFGAGACTGTASTYTWQGALQQAAAGATFAGHGDWRLPNIEELHSLVENRCYNPAINTTVFPGPMLSSLGRRRVQRQQSVGVGRPSLRPRAVLQQDECVPGAARWGESGHRSERHVDRRLQKSEVVVRRLVKRNVTCYDRLMIKSFRYKGLQRFFEKGSRSGVQARHERRLRLMLSRLDDVATAADMDAPAWKLHALKGELKGPWAVWIDGNWRLTFTFDGNHAILVNYQDYHLGDLMARMHNPPHPGEVLREFLPDATTIEEVARRLGVSRVQLSRVLNGRSAISADMAIRIGLLTGTTPESWLAGQAKRDLWQASQKPLPAVEPFRRAA